MSRREWAGTSPVKPSAVRNKSSILPDVEIDIPKRLPYSPSGLVEFDLTKAGAQ